MQSNRHPVITDDVWFYPAPSDSMVVHRTGARPQPCAGEVVYVWNDRCVNLDVKDHAGNHHARPSIAPVHDGETPPAGDYCAFAPLPNMLALSVRDGAQHA